MEEIDMKATAWIGGIGIFFDNGYLRIRCSSESEEGGSVSLSLNIEGLDENDIGYDRAPAWLEKDGQYRRYWISIGDRTKEEDIIVSGEKNANAIAEYISGVIRLAKIQAGIVDSDILGDVKDEVEATPELAKIITATGRARTARLKEFLQNLDDKITE